MKVGDLVKIKNLHPDWGKIGLITRVTHIDARPTQISLISNGVNRAIPWPKRDYYLEVI